MSARREAANRCVDEAIFRSSDGFLLEGPTSGLVIAADDRLWTTPTTGTGVLASVTIAALFAAARQHEVATGEALFTPADAYEADGMWLVSAIRGMLPVVELDGHAIHHDPAVTSVLAKATGFPGIA
ncbi:MAG: aminotransferase class IV [Propionicimonas sp.]|nr:aminotransferase class IV [Propionicimonas sp.]